jgi:hypothetical protein
MQTKVKTTAKIEKLEARLVSKLAGTADEGTGCSPLVRTKGQARESERARREGAASGAAMAAHCEQRLDSTAAVAHFRARWG